MGGQERTCPRRPKAPAPGTSGPRQPLANQNPWGRPETTVKCHDARLTLVKEPNEQSVRSDLQIAAVEHWQGCPECRRVLGVQWELARRVRRAGRAVGSPARVSERVAASVAIEHAPVPAVKALRRVAGVVVVLAAASIAFFVATGPDESPLAPQLVQLVQTPPAPENVKLTSNVGDLERWLQSQLGYAVHVPPIANAVPTAGRVLAGIGRAPAAAVSYDLAGGTLTYVALPREDEDAIRIPDTVETTTSPGGYHVATWLEFGERRAIVTTLPRDQVRAIAEECRRMALQQMAL